MELLVRTFDRYEGTDRVTQSKSTGRGDVIVVRPDGWAWGPAERKNPTYIILRVDIPDGEAMALASREPGDDAINTTLRIRLDRIDLDALRGLGYAVPAAEDCRSRRFPGGRDSLDLEARDIPVIAVTAAHLRVARTRKTPIPDPLVLGGR